ncbi:MAG TPA: GGDEF domain-containing protein [Myxococcales bacterium]|jgi:diguanylate cyclase (GGDEF)-like protein|nr:GGDEF domain-containing protein [Myxococcales bacterium]
MSKTKTVVTVISKISERAASHTSALVVIYGEDLGRKHDLEQEVTVIGRSSSCDIQIDQDSISRQHARIAHEDKGVSVSDMGSTNGTFVNDELVEGAQQLRNGDLIKIGRTIFKYIAGGNIESMYHEEIYRLTTTDGLTQVYNKRYFLETLEREVSRCHRYGRLLCLVMMDIDHFKKINDSFGHLAGDHVLKRVASAARSKIRREDIFARYGGEEFALILPEIETKGAVATAEKVRKIIEKQHFSFEDQDIPVTLSAGVASLGGSITDAQELIRVADVKLYEAKSSGRNRVCG